MPRFESFKNISQGIFYWLIIAAICLIAVWFIISGIGNYVLNRQEVKYPEADKARYALFITATSNTVFTDKYDISYHMTPTGEADKTKRVYTLHGYFELVKGKYVWNKGNISLDEYYWGKITLITRGG